MLPGLVSKRNISHSRGGGIRLGVDTAVANSDITASDSSSCIYMFVVGVDRRLEKEHKN